MTLVRAATPKDIPAMSDVLCASIRTLCIADHRNDPRVLDDWLSNKTPEAMRAWSLRDVWLAEQNGTCQAVGALHANTVTLLYVHPDARGQGVSRKLLAHLENLITMQGHNTAHLVSTMTALAFYRARGWRENGAPTPCQNTSGQPMIKTL